MLLPILILLPFLGCIAAAFMPTHARNREAWFDAAIALTSLILTLSQYWFISDGNVLRYQVSWMEQ
ncbi:hypothetical protein B0I24_1135 [Aliidiomarina maris]|uniref:NADH-quinone oxidoreductase subunit M n=1 Tax=Aliidiomarina maris TaxID=531312 RepID=A0A327WRT1_9GAMM|nr:hypothetical protein B0I24_1135 [Aliidiomarina maris]